jgi:hypothetical protein
MESKPALALVIVLGDLGRSPRMLAHARVLRARGWRVGLCGRCESGLPSDLASDPGVTVHDLGGGMGTGVVRLARIASDVRWGLAIVQNPPGFPALLALEWARARRSAAGRIVLDWHNTGAELLEAAPLWQNVYAAAERFAARGADTHLAVTAALARHVRRNIAAADVRVLRDAPGEMRPRMTSKDGRAAWWEAHAIRDSNEPAGASTPPEDAWWVVCPSSWGADEAMGWLLRVAARWSRAAGGRALALIATGRGAGRGAFARALALHESAGVNRGEASVHLAWFEPDDYRELLERADAGVCLHTSSSGLDFPMKLVDFAAAGLPAVAYDYGEALRETFPVDASDATFRSEDELVERLTALAMASGRAVRRKEARTWREAWEAVAPDVAGEGAIV